MLDKKFRVSLDKKPVLVLNREDKEKMMTDIAAFISPLIVIGVIVGILIAASPTVITSYETVLVFDKDKTVRKYADYKLYFKLNNSMHSVYVKDTEYIAASKGDRICVEKSSVKDRRPSFDLADEVNCQISQKQKGM